MRDTVTMTDLFAGAGGSSTGAVHAGVEIRLAANHWQKAIDVHWSNHPGADHLCADISAFNPRRIPSTTLLWASPECTFHSRARGAPIPTLDTPLFDENGETLPDEAADRSRATMWDVPRFTEVHGYEAIIVENVIEAAYWPPFQAWLAAMWSYGYLYEIVCLNSMHAQAQGRPAPQSRDRMYVVFWKKGNRKPDLSGMTRPRAWCPDCDEVVDTIQWWKRKDIIVGRYRQQYHYICPRCSSILEPGWVPAAAAIDWSMPGQRIGDRARPLAEKTRRRIAAGIARYWQPTVIEAAGNTYDAADPKHRYYGDPMSYYRTWPVDEVLKTLHTVESKALVVQMEGRAGDPRTVDQVLRTQTARHLDGLVVPAGGTWNDDARPVDEAHRTITTRETSALVTPFIAELRGGGSTARSVDDPLATVTASGNHHGLCIPYYGTRAEAKPTSDPIGTLTTVDRYALLMRNNGSKGDGAEMSTPVSEVMRTLTTMGHQSLVTTEDLERAAERVDDCLFRMLEPHEVAAGMAFPHDYQWEGTRRERVKMAGNAVTPPAARDIVACVMESLEPTS